MLHTLNKINGLQMEIKLKWWTILCSSFLILFLSYHFGYLHQLYNADITKLSWVIIGLFFLLNIRLGYQLHTDRKTGNNFDWLMSETMISLGMVGTVVGFIYMLSTIFTDINLDDIRSVQDSLGIMATGMGTALWTTLIGLICSILYKTELVLTEPLNFARNEHEI
jgi:hypothetical protein